MCLVAQRPGADIIHSGLGTLTLHREPPGRGEPDDAISLAYAYHVLFLPQLISRSAKQHFVNRRPIHCCPAVSPRRMNDDRCPRGRVTGVVHSREGLAS